MFNSELNHVEKILQAALDGNDVDVHYDERKASKIEHMLAKFIKKKEIESDVLAKEHAQIHALIADISHQTKTPLTTLSLYADMLAESQLSDAQRNYSTAISEQINELKFLIDALLLGSRLENGIITPQPIKQAIMPIIETSANRIKPSCNQKHITLSVEPTDAQAICDSKWTNEAINCILDNAVKYTPVNGTIAIKVISYALMTSIKVSDTGIGFNPNDAHKLFKRFYRAENVQNYDGLGIGLFIANQIATKQGGYIKADSKLGHGASFELFMRRD